jgi:hypothetical protein
LAIASPAVSGGVAWIHDPCEKYSEDQENFWNILGAHDSGAYSARRSISSKQYLWLVSAGRKWEGSGCFVFAGRPSKI